MSRLDLITIAIVIVCLAALGYLVYKIVHLMNPPQKETTSIQDSYTDPAPTDDSTYTDWDDEVTSATAGSDLDDEDLGSSDTDNDATTNDSGSYNNDELDNDSNDIAEMDSSTSKSTESDSDSGQAATAYDNSSSSSGSGNYLVLAGSYRQKNNAENQAAKLRKLGYSGSSVENFNRGSYAVVLVDRFHKYSEAKALVRKLANDGVEAMVKEKN